MKTTETALQIDCVKWFNSEFPDLRGLLFHIPNEVMISNKEQRIKTIGKLISMGLVPGIPDLMLAIPSQRNAGMFIELKNGRNGTSGAQDLIISRLQYRTYHTVVVRSLESFKIEIYKYLELCTIR